AAVAGATRAAAHATPGPGGRDGPVRLLLDGGAELVRQPDHGHRRRTEGGPGDPVGPDARLAPPGRGGRRRRRAHARAGGGEEGCRPGDPRSEGPDRNGWRGGRLGPDGRGARGACLAGALLAGGARGPRRPPHRRGPPGRGPAPRGASDGPNVRGKEAEDFVRVVVAEVVDEEREFDAALRPRWLSEFVGQARIKEQLQLL